ncbi:GNAT family N-acetyltransferase [Herbihabitans rhizosphaerae]|uniref:GNAT family N-acetyltransferase n=1 Tax=Herbihabitans rhizosphaerae TaxID=1872711 RepID=UPI001F5F5579|nr:GNAT family N-acetyltransferase [Herbihabitans rhizosphaerae]
MRDESLPDLIRRWQTGWGPSRGLPVAEESRGGLHVLIGKPDRHRETFVLDADSDPDSLRRLAEDVADAAEPDWLTVPTTEPEAVKLIAKDAGLVPHGATEYLMSIDLADHPRSAAQPPYAVATGVDGQVITARVTHPSGGDAAAAGVMAVNGWDAVADRIETREEHRRRGLGSVVMSALVAEAVTLGAVTGLLVASQDGQHLYSKLGWIRHADILIFTAPR